MKRPECRHGHKQIENLVKQTFPHEGLLANTKAISVRICGPNRKVTWRNALCGIPLLTFICTTYSQCRATYCICICFIHRNGTYTANSDCNFSCQRAKFNIYFRHGSRKRTLELQVTGFKCLNTVGGLRSCGGRRRQRNKTRLLAYLKADMVHKCSHHNITKGWPQLLSWLSQGALFQNKTGLICNHCPDVFNCK
jgi:hypothetical protein